MYRLFEYAQKKTANYFFMRKLSYGLLHLIEPVLEGEDAVGGGAGSAALAPTRAAGGCAVGAALAENVEPLQADGAALVLQHSVLALEVPDEVVAVGAAHLIAELAGEAGGGAQHEVVVGTPLGI